MRKLLYIILFFLTFAACRTTSESVKTDIEVNSVTNYDSLFENFLQVEAGKYAEIQRNVYDSVITHVTIVRYDTVVINGEPIIKEKIIIEKVEVSGENTHEQEIDSTYSTDIVSVSVTNKDTLQIQKHEQTKKKQLNKGNMLTFLLFIIVVLMSYIFIQHIKAKR